MKKKIILSLPYGMSIRDLISEKFINILLKKYEIYIFSSIFNDPHSKKYFKKFKNLKLFNYKKNNIIESGLISLISNLKTIKKIKEKNLLSFKTIKEALRNGNSNFILENDYKKLNSKLLNFIASVSVFYYSIMAISKAILFIFSIKYFFLFYKKNFSFFFTSHPYCNLDYPLEYCSRIFNCRQIAMIHSWDNIHSKLVMHFNYSKIFVWNKIMTNQLKYIYNYNKKNIYEIGIPQFDDYKINNNFLSKKEFNKLVKNKNNKKIITCFCGCPDLTPNYNKILEQISNLFLLENLKRKYKLIVRCHPGYDYTWTKKIADHKNTFVNIPGNLSVPMEVKNIKKSDEERKFLCSILKYSDVIINFFSTTAIDAVYFNKPVIGMCIDEKSKEKLPGSQLSYYYSWTHYRNLMKTDGIDLCKKVNDLKYIIKKVSKKKYKYQKREKIFKTQIVFRDGRTRERIANHLLELK